ncbi:hypothetical protein KKC13_11515 [bacterium]|nr:hypothetical protein [bacterium]MBU1957919.1 hypothetical protein [bacterium]
MKNLDAEINKAGYEISKVIDENLINKILGVLAQDGVYAMWVYCKSKKDIDENKLLETLNAILESNDDYEQYFQNLSKDLNQLLFFKEILEKALTYARYHAKAMD